MILSALDYYMVICITSGIIMLPLLNILQNWQKAFCAFISLPEQKWQEKGFSYILLLHCSQFSSLSSAIEKLNYHLPSARDSCCMDYKLHYPGWVISVKSTLSRLWCFAGCIECIVNMTI